MKFVSRISVLAVSAAFLGLAAVGPASAGGSLVISGNSSSSWAKGSFDYKGNPVSNTAGHSDSLVVAGGKSGSGSAGGHYYGDANASKKSTGGKPTMGGKDNRSPSNNNNNGGSEQRTSATVAGGSHASASVGGCGCSY